MASANIRMTDSHSFPPPANEGLAAFARDLIAPADAFKGGMRRLAGAVNIVATAHEGERNGLTATAVTSLSAEPPRLLACVNLSGRTFQLIAASRRMSVNVLGRDQEDVAKRFAGMLGEPGSNPFEVTNWDTSARGIPMLHGALASFDCVVEEMLVTHTHAVLIGEVKEVVATDPEAPLLYMNGRFGSFDGGEQQ
ncbi:flavin reductase family protein [Arhodomonas sp. SL1]|uniref:flavin reductase family protein n=1 Tax=Arhodomonas sp. SL1 TaxID=3425691 RepID=UPI003F8815F1